MSENGPYNQPPQNPYGGDGTGGQPPYGPPGGPYGDPHTGGQPGYAQQGAYTGGQPAYGPPGGYPPPQPPKSGGKAALWVVIGGGAVIAVLVVALIIMLPTNREAPGGNVADPPQVSPEATDPVTEPEEPVEEPAGGGGPTGEPPYALPIEPCEALTDREVAVLRALQSTLSLRELSAELYLSLNTVKSYARVLYRKLDVHTRAEAVTRGRELGLI
jgi:DNA-binding CsgD family transcriptional regulator